MFPVEIVPIQGTLVLRARGSELLILPHHIVELKTLKQPKDFTGYFMRSALINRPARKLFEAWLRKDGGLWKRLYHTVQDMEQNDEAVAERDAVQEEKEVKKAPVTKTEKPEVATKVKSTSAKAEPSKKEVESKKTAPAQTKVARKEKEELKEEQPKAKKKTTAAAKAAPAKKAVKKAEPAAKKPAAKKVAAKKAPAAKAPAKKVVKKATKAAKKK